MTPMSYLFAKIKTEASLKSSSYNIDYSSCLAKSTPKIFIKLLNQVNFKKNNIIQFFEIIIDTNQNLEIYNAYFYLINIYLYFIIKLFLK